MRILVVGGGGREHALVWKIRQSPLAEEVLCAPGNAGIARTARCVSVAANDVEGLLALARGERIDLTVVGPEEPLVRGLADRFQDEGLLLFGVSQRAAAMEGSKTFAKDLMIRHGIPTGAFAAFTDAETARRHVRDVGAPIVVKADGLAAGKGVFPCRSVEEALAAVDRIMVQREFGAAGDRVVVEEFLDGEEASFLAITDGQTVVPFPSSQDHKAIYDGDEGPNTGGMGAYSPAPVVTPEIHDQVMEDIMIPTVRAMAQEGRPYQGILYAGLMISRGKAKVLEFNVRLGDPEAQPLLIRMTGDLVPVLLAAVQGKLHEAPMTWDPRSAVCVVMASGGYPGHYEKGKRIAGLEDAGRLEDVVVFHAGTREREGQILTDGGRVLGVTARGRDVEEAIQVAYRAVDLIRWEGAHFRRDIGRKALREKEVSER
jgi:phosphoribosylamine---glycine ligase